MPAQWFFVPYVRRDTGKTGLDRSRYCMVDDFTQRIHADGGDWSEFECGGGPGTSFVAGAAGVKVGGVTQATLDAITAASQTSPIPTTLLELSTSLSVLTTPQRNTLQKALANSLGYSDQEVTDWLAGATLASKTYGQLLDFLATRWYTPVYDPAGSQVGYQGVTYPGVIACDGRTVASTGAVSQRLSPPPSSPASVAARIPST
jgi:hypothetical protein